MSDFKPNSELIGNNEEMLLERGHPRRTPGHLFGIIYQKFGNLPPQQPCPGSPGTARCSCALCSRAEGQARKP